MIEIKLLVEDENQARRLRDLVIRHGALAEPVVNNDHPHWKVFSGDQEIFPNEIHNIKVRLPDEN